MLQAVESRGLVVLVESQGEEFRFQFVEDIFPESRALLPVLDSLVNHP